MLMMQNRMTDTEVEPDLPVAAAHYLLPGGVTSKGLNLSISTNNVGSLPNAVVFHDSFFNNMKRSFVETTGRSVMVGAGGGNILMFELDIIERERPQVVVEEIVERYLAGQPYVPDEILMWYQMGGVNK